MHGTIRLGSGVGCRIVHARLLAAGLASGVLAGLPATADQTRPYGGKPQTIPGVVEAENYDEGPPGAAYHDVDEVNHGADYRGTTHVDIEQRPDASNQHGLGWTRKGEWVVYTVEVQQTGTYRLEVPVASQKQGGIFHLEIGERDLTGPIRVPDTGGWQKLKTIRPAEVQLERGVHRLKLVMDAEGPSGNIGDIDLFRFTRSP